ncbi:MAG: hypothetical protein AB4038_00235 [Prochloraceae cyanobacterium]
MPETTFIILRVRISEKLTNRNLYGYIMTEFPSKSNPTKFNDHASFESHLEIIERLQNIQQSISTSLSWTQSWSVVDSFATKKKIPRVSLFFGEVPYYPSWLINPDSKPNLLQDDYHYGYQDYLDDLPALYPKNAEYIRGWQQAKGMYFGYSDIGDVLELEGNVVIFPNDIHFTEGYFLGLIAKHPEVGGISQGERIKKRYRQLEDNEGKFRVFEDNYSQ